MIQRAPVICLGLISALGFAAPASADPCEGRLPSRAGQEFAGEVRYVGDGDSLCVGGSAEPADWIEVRLADFDAPELHSPQGPRAKALLEGLTLGRFASCRAEVGRRGRVIVWDRVIARCRINGESVGSLLRAVGAPEGGR